MTGLRFWRHLLAAPVFLGLAVFSAGCGGDKKEPASGKAKDSGGSKASSSTKAAGKSEKTALTAATGTLKGKVTLDGETPKPRDLKPDMEKQKDKDHCLKMDPKNDMTD